MPKDIRDMTDAEKVEASNRMRSFSLKMATDAENAGLSLAEFATCCLVLFQFFSNSKDTSQAIERMGQVQTDAMRRAVNQAMTGGNKNAN